MDMLLNIIVLIVRILKMKYKSILILFLIICFVITSTLIYYVSIYMHENAHERFMVYDGCKDVKIHIGLTGGYTQCLDPSYIESDNAMILHSINEVINYNLQVLITTIILCSFIICLVMILK